MLQSQKYSCCRSQKLNMKSASFFEVFFCCILSETLQLLQVNYYFNMKGSWLSESILDWSVISVLCS